MEHNEVVRYSDAELEEFRVLIETKLDRAQKHLAELQEQILEITENTSDEHGGDWVDDSSINNDVEMLNNMAIRQRMHIQDLDNALVRIKNKTYGICTISGQLIDKRRLLAVPTTTKSLAAKVAEQATPPPVEKKEKSDFGLEERPKPVEKEKTPPQKRIISTVIRKSGTKKKQQVDLDDFEEVDEDLNVSQDLFYEEEQELLYGSASDIDDLMEDQGSSSSTRMDEGDDDDDDMGEDY